MFALQKHCTIGTFSLLILTFLVLIHRFKQLHGKSIHRERHRVLSMFITSSHATWNKRKLTQFTLDGSCLCRHIDFRNEQSNHFLVSPVNWQRALSHRSSYFNLFNSLSVSLMSRVCFNLREENERTTRVTSEASTTRNCPNTLAWNVYQPPMHSRFSVSTSLHEEA